MDLHISDKSGGQIAEQVADEFRGQLSEDCRDFRVAIAKPYGKGNLRFIDFVDVISLFSLDVMFFDRCIIYFKRGANELMRFNYCIEGNVHHHLSNGNLISSLSQYKGSVSANPRDQEQVLIIPAHTKIRFLSIELDRRSYQDKLPCDLSFIPKKLLEVLEDDHAADLFHYQHNYAHIIHEEALEIFEDKYAGLIKTTHQEAKALEIIAQQYKQYKEDVETSGPKKMLKEFELSKLSEARQILRQEMKHPPTIVELAKRVGINQQKLKTGFKNLYGFTINNYVQKLRLEHARALLLTGKFSIKEVAYEVGYENRSFFARKFRERFEMLPSDLTRQQSSERSSAS